MKKILIISTVFLLLTACNKENTETTTPTASFSGKLKTLKRKVVGVPEIDMYEFIYDSITGNIKEVVHNNIVEYTFDYQLNVIYITAYGIYRHYKVSLLDNNIQTMSELDTNTMTYYDKIKFYFQDRIDSVSLNAENYPYTYLKGNLKNFQYIGGNCESFIHNYWDRGSPFPYPFINHTDSLFISYNSLDWNKYVPYQNINGIDFNISPGYFEFIDLYNIAYHVGFNGINSSLSNKNLLESSKWVKHEYIRNTKNQIQKITTYYVNPLEKAFTTNLEYYP